MFHVEQYISQWFERNSIEIADKTIRLLSRYAVLIHETNTAFNLTGFKSLEEITHHLVLLSLEPLLNLNVPRGTRFIDVGTGAGIPGIPLCIFHNQLSGTLLDSNHKKTGFIDGIISDLSLTNAGTLCGRAEELGHDSLHREQYGMAFSRALAGIYAALELSLPFVDAGGYLYVFSHDNSIHTTLSQPVLDHANELGAQFVSGQDRHIHGISAAGYLFKKTRSTPDRYPRRFAVIKRESDRYRTIDLDKQQ